MGEVVQFSYGWVTPVGAYIMSFLGCLLGFMIARKARRRSGSERTRLLIYASLAFGAIGIWQMHMIALLGLGLVGSGVTFDPIALAVSFVVAVADIGTALFVAGFGRRVWWRTLLAGLILALGATAAQYLVLSAVRMNGEVHYAERAFYTTLAIAVVVAAGSMWATRSARRLRYSALAALVIATALTSMHYIGTLAIQRRPGRPTSDLMTGLTPLALLAPVILIGAVVITMLAFFTLGNASAHELNAIFAPTADAIDPALVEEMTMRIDLGIANDEGPLDARLGVARAYDPARPRPRPTPGTVPAWHSMPVWGDAAGAELVAVGRSRTTPLTESAAAKKQAPNDPNRRRRRSLVRTNVTAPQLTGAGQPALIQGAVVSSSTTIYASAALAGAPLEQGARSNAELPSRYPPGFRPAEPEPREAVSRAQRPRNQRRL